MKTSFIVFFVLLLVILVSTIIFYESPGKMPESPKTERTWVIKSIDTMKYSRDLSLEKLKNPKFDKEIDSHFNAIKSLNASHAAIGTPYDEKFAPILARWVKSARKNSLKVWFRGNFSAWEGWFGENRNSITREEHIQKTRDFIKNNPGLFEDGDIFSPCPECENGGPGDPRENGDVDGHRNFLISERSAALEEFEKIGKKVTVLDSMNYDVAQLVMDKKTAKSMGGIVAIDHYIETPQKLSYDIDGLAESSDAKIFLGEIGVPIPDIHGSLSPEDQAVWIEDALNQISKKQSVIGVNYWVLTGGSTALFNNNLEPKPAAQVIKKYFSLKDFN